MKVTTFRCDGNELRRPKELVQSGSTQTTTYIWDGSDYLGEVNYKPLSYDPLKEACICSLATKVSDGWVLCGSSWVDNNSCQTYSLLSHNCQDYVICILHSCGIESSSINPDPWEWTKEGPVLYLTAEKGPEMGYKYQ